MWPFDINECDIEGNRQKLSVEKSMVLKKFLQASLRIMDLSKRLSWLVRIGILLPLHPALFSITFELTTLDLNENETISRVCEQ